MATGTQAAQLFLSKVGEPTAIDTCVKSMVKEIFNPLAVPVPPIVWVHEIMQPPFTKVDNPSIGDVGIFPGAGHACMITGISGNTLTETSFGTATGKVRSANYDVSFYQSFYRPPYDGALSTINTASAGGPTPVSNALGVPASVYTPQWWTRIGVGLLGAIVAAVALYMLIASTDVGQSVIASGKRIAKTAAEAAVVT